MYRQAPFLILLLATAPAGGIGGESTAGVLRIQTLPEVEVAWEGVLIGTTDAEGALVIRDIPPGAYAVTFRKVGFREVLARIEVQPGADTTFPLRLEESGSTANSPQASRGGRPPPEPVPADGPQRPPLGVSDEARGGNPPHSGTEGELTRPLLSNERAFLLLLLAAAGILLVYRAAATRPRRSGEPRAASPPRGARFTESQRIDWNRPVPAFLEDLSRREKTLDHLGDADPSSEEIIEVEFTEVRPVEDDP